MKHLKKIVANTNTLQNIYCIGETEKEVKERIKEHISYAKN